jgi:hypothetical protein
MAAIEQMVVHGKAGQPIELPIAEGPATGYSWQLELPDGVIRLADGRHGGRRRADISARPSAERSAYRRRRGDSPSPRVSCVHGAAMR